MSMTPWLIAIPLAALAMGGWRRLVTVVFKKRSRKVFDRMLRLVAIARLMVFHAVLESYGPGPAGERLAMKMVQCLFSDPNRDGEIDDMFLEATKAEAMMWLHAKPLWQDLVLQTLRVEAAARAGKGEISHNDVMTKLTNSPVVQTYGESYPTEMNPQLYTELLKRTFDRTSDRVRNAVQQRMNASPPVV